MSSNLTQAVVRRLDLPRMPREVLCELLFLARGKGTVLITHEALAKRLSVSRKSVTRALTALREIGLLTTERTQRSRDGYRGADRITFAERVPLQGRAQGDRMSLKVGAPCGPECPTGLRDKMSQPIEDSSKSGDRDHESGRRAGDVEASEGPRHEPVNDGPSLRLISGGKAA